MNANTGKALSGIDHLRQSIRDILTTPIGSRVMRREYGSQLFSLLDAPLNRSGLMDLVAASAEAIERWEPRFKATSIEPVSTGNASMAFDISGYFLPSGQVVTLEGIVVR